MDRWMGSSLFPVIANLYLESLEETAIQSASFMAELRWGMWMTHWSSGPMGLAGYSHFTNTLTVNTLRSILQLKRKMTSCPSLMSWSRRKEEEYWPQCTASPPTLIGTFPTTSTTTWGPQPESWDAWAIEHTTSTIPQRCSRKWTI